MYASRKYDEYALKLCEQYKKSDDPDEAWRWAEIAIGSEYEDIKNRAVSLMQDIQEEKNSKDAQHQPEQELVNPANKN